MTTKIFTEGIVLMCLGSFMAGFGIAWQLARWGVL
jgi:hypothetical protein